ncbi:vegetative cell wall protein gp1-like [Humulus lupulus]|uniref:vegetative cell wall protein gp1-like n=1 Tax=Humulus lupulus TaxID=3486 RepID=UPI002B41860A|nr:vegetative cell wall protein gp1-like [Humulus lupulus]
MEPPLSTLVFVVFGFLISVCALHVESELLSLDGLNRSPEPPTGPPPSASPPLGRSPPPPSRSPPVSSSPAPPVPSSPPPVPSPAPPPSWSPSRNPSPLHHGIQPNKSPINIAKPPPSNKNPQSQPPPPHEHKINAGKKIGLLFSGIAAILQIGVISFLVFKRRQLLKVNGRYETCS